MVFEELARQTAVHSTQLARLLTKVWDGADGVTSRYNHGYEKAHKRCSFLQDEMKRVAEEAMKHVDGSKIELDDVKMQLAISRAAVREREGRIDTLQHANRQLAAECDARQHRYCMMILFASVLPAPETLRVAHGGGAGGRTGAGRGSR